MSYLKALLAIALYSFSSHVLAADPRAILVWSIFDGEHHIVSSSLVEEQWSEPVAIHSSDNLIVTPSLAKSDDGQTILVWSQQQQGGMEIFQSLFSDGEWSEAEPLVDKGSENLNPNILNDGQGGLWLFWSGNNGGLDDIYYKNKTAGDAEWSETQQLNAPNEAPDYKPIAELDQFGDILVRWQTFDFLSNTYIEVQETIVIEQKVAYNPAQAENDIKLEDILMPDFLPSDSAVSLMFPNNVAAQSIRID